MPGEDDGHGASVQGKGGVSAKDGCGAPARSGRDAFSASADAPFAADFRAAGEDDDGYDPYSDYMDALGRMDDEELCEDPWR